MTTAPRSRPEIVCPDSGPEPPYPLRMEGEVISGFGRGSKELGIPTANLPVDAATTPWIESAKSGVYFGYASLALPPTHPDYAYHDNSSSGSGSGNPTTTSTSTSASASSPPQPNSQASPTSNGPPPPSPPPERRWHVYPMVMSIGYNPFYKNSVRSAEVHILRGFRADFYGAPLRLLILGFIRDELDYAGLEALVADINTDCEVARRSLARAAWAPREGTVVGGSAGGTLDGSWLVREEKE